MSGLNQASVNFFTLKWGDKYGPEYVNRLYNSLKLYCLTDFTFTLVTDKPYDDYAEGIQVMSILHLRLFRSTIFTAEKLDIMSMFHGENNVLLDLDILIHNDITELVTQPSSRPIFVYTYWTPNWHWTKLLVNKKACFVNSSFVKWSGNQAAYIDEHFTKNYDAMIEEYDSFDKYMFYEHAIATESGGVDWWPEGIFYNYNEGPHKYELLEDHAVCLFNTSHLVKQGKRHYELHNTPSEHTDIWEGYDDV